MLFHKVRTFLVLLFISITASASANEKAVLVFDGRDWELGWSNKTNDKSVFDEYILKGENVENWSEIVTVQFFPALQKRNLEVYENEFKNSLARGCQQKIEEWINYETKKDERIFYFSSKNSLVGPKEQSCIARVFNTDKGTHVFQYAIKGSPMPDKNKRIWMKILKDIKVKEIQD